MPTSETFPRRRTPSLVQSYGPGSPRRWSGTAAVLPLPLAHSPLPRDEPRPAALRLGGPRGNVSLKKAVNFAIDREPLMSQRGAYAGTPTDQHLPRGMTADSSDVDIYPSRPDLAPSARACRLGHPGTEPRRLSTAPNRAPAPQIARSSRPTCGRSGSRWRSSSSRARSSSSSHGRRGEPFDMTLEGWHMDYYDPFDFLFLLDGTHADAGEQPQLRLLQRPGVQPAGSRRAPTS